MQPGVLPLQAPELGLFARETTLARKDIGRWAPRTFTQLPLPGAEHIGPDLELAADLVLLDANPLTDITVRTGHIGNTLDRRHR